MAAEAAEERVLLSSNPVPGEPGSYELCRASSLSAHGPTALATRETRKRLSREPGAQVKCSATKLALSHRAMEEEEDWTAHRETAGK